MAIEDPPPQEGDTAAQPEPNQQTQRSSGRQKTRPDYAKMNSGEQLPRVYKKHKHAPQQAKAPAPATHAAHAAHAVPPAAPIYPTRLADLAATYLWDKKILPLLLPTEMVALSHVCTDYKV